MGQICGQLDLSNRPNILQPHFYVYPNSRSVPLLHIFRYMDSLCPPVITGHRHCDGIGSEACVYGGVLNTNKTSNFPIANYTVDGILGEFLNRVAP